MATYVVKSWYADQRANPQGHYVSIKGRAPGLISWLLSLIGISPTVSLECSGNNFIYEVGSWSGRQIKTIPLSKLSSVYYGYAKPWKTALMIGILGIAIGVFVAVLTHNIAASLLIMLIFLILAIGYYLLNKDLSIGVCEVGGIVSGIEFKHSLIEGVAVDEAAAERVHLIILALVERINVKQ